MKSDVIYRTLKLLKKNNINFLSVKKEIEKGGSKLSEDLKYILKKYNYAYDYLNNKNLDFDCLIKIADILDIKLEYKKRDIFLFNVLTENININSIPSIMSCISRLSKDNPELSFFIGAFYIDKSHDIDTNLSHDYFENVKTMESTDLISYIKGIIKDK